MSVVIPAKNEAENIKSLVSELINSIPHEYSFEIIYVDDGSSDNTAANITALMPHYSGKLRLLQHEKSVGQSTAIHSGVLNARGDLIITLDGDGQNNPADIPKLLEEVKLLPLGVDFCIAGYRKARKDTAWKRFQSRLANRVRAALLKDNTPDTGCGLKIFPRNTFLKMPYFNHMHRYIPALTQRVGGKVVVVEVSHRDRNFGSSKYGMWGRLFAGLLDLCGVMWLQHRTKLVTVKEASNEQ